MYRSGIIDAILPRYFNDVKMYGTWNSCFESVLTLKSIFVPKTYRIIQMDFCPNCYNLESVVFEETSEIESIGSFVVQGTAIKTITLPSSLKSFSSYCAFRDCNKLKQIIFMGIIAIDYDFEMFNNVPSDVIINVGKKYPSKTFGGINVTLLNLPKPRRILTCTKNRRINTSLLFVILICFS